jgi:hypothetical protein
MIPGKTILISKKKTRFPRKQATTEKEALEFRTLEKRERKNMRNRPQESRCKKGAQGMLRAEPPRPKVARPLFFF